MHETKTQLMIIETKGLILIKHYTKRLSNKITFCPKTKELRIITIFVKMAFFHLSFQAINETKKILDIKKQRKI